MKKIKEIEVEIEKLKTLQSKLIRQHDQFFLKLEKRKTPKKEKDKKVSEFMEKYLDYRLKIGTKWMKLLDQKMEIEGRTQLVKINEEVLNDF